MIVKRALVVTLGAKNRNQWQWVLLYLVHIDKQQQQPVEQSNYDKDIQVRAKSSIDTGLKGIRHVR